jgi:hypothetical protein
MRLTDTKAAISRMANAAKSNPGFLAHHLDAYCARHDISAAALCVMLAIDPNALPTLCLCLGPKPGESADVYVAQLLSGGNRLGVDADALLEILTDR